MRLINLLIIVSVAAGIGIGAYVVGHAVSEPAKALDTVVVSTPARAASATAEANLGAAVSAAASYKVDHGTYAGMSTNDLQSYDNALASGVSVKKATDSRLLRREHGRGCDRQHHGPERDVRRPRLLDRGSRTSKSCSTAASCVFVSAAAARLSASSASSCSMRRP